MPFAIKNDQPDVLAKLGAEGAVCPLCKSEVLARCGEKNVWHWAHKKELAVIGGLNQIVYGESNGLRHLMVVC